MTEKRKPLTRRQLREMERAEAARNEAESADHDTTDTLFIPLSEEPQDPGSESAETEPPQNGSSVADPPVMEPPAPDQPDLVPPTAAGASDSDQASQPDAVVDPGLETELINTQDAPDFVTEEGATAQAEPSSSEPGNEGPGDEGPAGDEPSQNAEKLDSVDAGTPEEVTYPSRRTRRRAQRAEAGQSEESLSELTRQALAAPMDQESEGVDDESQAFDEFESDRIAKLRTVWGTAESPDLPAFNDLLGLGASQPDSAEQSPDQRPEETPGELEDAAGDEQGTPPSSGQARLDSEQLAAHRDAQRRIESTGIIAPVTRNVEILLPQEAPASEAPRQTSRPETAPNTTTESSTDADRESNRPVAAETAHGLEPLSYHDGGARRRTVGTSIVAGSTILAVGAIVFAFLL